jgi:hypothetical protein
VPVGRPPFSRCCYLIIELGSRGRVHDVPFARRLDGAGLAAGALTARALLFSMIRVVGPFYLEVYFFLKYSCPRVWPLTNIPESTGNIVPRTGTNMNVN